MCTILFTYNAALNAHDWFFSESKCFAFRKSVVKRQYIYIILYNALHYNAHTHTWDNVIGMSQIEFECRKKIMPGFVRAEYTLLVHSLYVFFSPAFPFWFFHIFFLNFNKQDTAEIVQERKNKMLLHQTSDIFFIQGSFRAFLVVSVSFNSLLLLNSKIFACLNTESNLFKVGVRLSHSLNSERR